MEPNNNLQPPAFNQPVQQQSFQQQPYYGMPRMKPQMGFIEAIKTVLVNKYCCFTGRARRSEYWNWVLAYGIISVVLSVFNMFMMVSQIETIDLDDPLSLYKSPGYFVTALVGLALFLPNLGVTIRRLHDTGHSGWWLVVPIIVYIPMLWASWSMQSNPDSAIAVMSALLVCALIMLVICIIVLVWLCRDSDPRENQYGPSPKYSTSIED